LRNDARWCGKKMSLPVSILACQSERREARVDRSAMMCRFHATAPTRLQTPENNIQNA
jgi:hypothetical protein